MNLKKRIAIMVVLIGLMLMGSVAAIFVLKSNYGGANVVAYIYRDNELIKEIDLSDVKEEYDVRIDYEDGEYNILRVRQGSIGIVEASCPDQLCKNMGFISDSVMPVTCLPNHLVIQVKRKGDNTDIENDTLDGVAY